MANTALGAEKEKAIIFISDAHEKFYYEKLKEVRYQPYFRRQPGDCGSNIRTGSRR